MSQTQTVQDTFLIDIPQHIQKVQRLFRLCDKAGLDRSVVRGQQLYDDGTHGDAVENDGIFTFRYTDTDIEGTYTFNFSASGSAPSGSDFSRIKTLSKHKSIEPAPGPSKLDFVGLTLDGNVRSIEVYTILRNRFGGYLGPGHGPLIQFENERGGKFTGPVRDYNNGVYSRVLVYDESKERPKVQVRVRDRLLKSIRLFNAFEVSPIAGRFVMADDLGLQDGNFAGARLGYRVTNPLAVEVEGGMTFTKDGAGNSGNLLQAMGQLRYDLYNLRVSEWIPFVSVGAGYIFFRGFAKDEETFAFQGGVGSILNLSNSLSIRVDGKIFRINDVLGAGATTNFQLSVGLVFRF